jgi:hypothetical protein
LGLEVIANGLWRWTAPHPAWKPGEPGSPDDWPREVGCVLYETAEHAVFIDPLVNDEEEAAFWEWADGRCAGRAVAALETIEVHRRSRERILERYGASTAPPPGVEPLEFPQLEETMYWIPAHRALVPGDRLLTSGPTGELTLCPSSWFYYLPGPPTAEQASETLAPLRALDVEIVLVSHGEPVLTSGAAAIARALEQPLSAG